MSGIMASVDQRTQLAGHNRLELLLFRLDGTQLYGINVFKVREVLLCPALSTIPQANPVVRGICNIRGQTISVMDLSLAIDLLKQWADNNDSQLDRLAMVISDIEMPEMDGYTFTTEVRADERLKGIYIILHTSMSGVFNQGMVDRIGANNFITRFEPDLLAQAVMDALEAT